MSDNGVVFLEGRKTILRPPDKAIDLEVTTRWVNDPQVQQFILKTVPFTRQQEAEWFDKLGQDPNNIVLTIVAKPEMRPIGIMGIHRIDWVNRHATTGALIGEKEYWGKGYGTDAKMVLLDYLFNRLGLHKVCSNTIVFNTRSLDYSLHCGYHTEGTFRRHIFRNGRYWDMVNLAVFRQDWLPIWRRWKKTGSVKK